MSDIPQSIRSLIIHHHEHGETFTQIALMANVSRWTVSRIVSLHRNTGSTNTRRSGNCGRPSLLSTHTRRRLRRTAGTNPAMSSRQIQLEVGTEAMNVSTRTVRRSLRNSGVICYRPVNAPSLNPSRKRNRLEWARAHSNWTVKPMAKSCV